MTTTDPEVERIGEPTRTCSFECCDRPVQAIGLCNGHYKQKREGKSLQPLIHTEIARSNRFWSKVQKSNGCWLWTGRVKPTGYGQIRAGGRVAAAHRVSWEIEHGPIPSGMWVLHACDVPGCVRPSHLFLGSHADNMADMARKLRQRTKLTVNDVLSIRSSTESQRIIARRYGIDQTLVSGIKRRRKWAHLAESQP